VSVADADEVTHRRVEADHERALATVLGQVTVRRLAYRAPGGQPAPPVDNRGEPEGRARSSA